MENFIFQNPTRIIFRNGAEAATSLHVGNFVTLGKDDVVSLYRLAQ